MKVGIIADTHGVLLSSVVEALAGVDLILHAGDIGGTHVGDDSATVLRALTDIAPVRMVIGNCDPAKSFPREVELEFEGVRVHVSHGHEFGRVWLATPERLLARYPDADVIVFGHTHKVLVHRVDDKLVLNPGSAQGKKPSVAILTLPSREVEVRYVATV